MGEELELFPKEELVSENIVTETPAEIGDAEWCFQFFNNEPIVFAYSNENEVAAPLTLQIQSIEGQGLNFQQNGMVFRIFPRPISEETKLERKNVNKDDIR